MTLTYGEKAVGLSFNPSGNPKVDQIKALYAQIIDLCNDERSVLAHPIDADKARAFPVAITEAQTSQMWAVKGLTLPG